MSDNVPNGRTLKTILWVVSAAVAIVIGVNSTQAWADSRYAASDRVGRIEDDVREMKSDIKEILRRLPR